jgi:tetratricopeptide (TPR) repeat protein
MEQAGQAMRIVLGLPGNGPWNGAARRQTAVWFRAIALLTSGREPDDDEPDIFPDDSRPDGDDPYGRALWFLAYARWAGGALAEGAALNESVLRRFRAHRDTWGTAAALVLRAAFAAGHGDLATLDSSGMESARLFSVLGDQWGQMKATDLLGVLAEIKGDYPRAARLHEYGLRIATDLDLRSQTARKLAMLGRIALLTGHYEKADELHARSVELAEEQGNMPWQVFARTGLAISARRRGRLDDAEKRLTDLLPALEQMRASNGLAFAYAELGFLAELRGDAEHALACHRDGLAAADVTPDRRAVALALEGLAGAHLVAAQAELAARLLGAAAQIRESVRAPLPSGERQDVDRITAGAKDVLGGDRFAACFAAGSAGEQFREAGGVSVLSAYLDLT